MTATDAPQPTADRPDPDRSTISRITYRLTQSAIRLGFAFTGGFRCSGQEHVPERGPAMLVSNHLSFWDVFLLGAGIRRPMSYVARSTLFKPLVGWYLRLIGAFPIQRDGIGVQGFKETLRRLRRGGIVVLFPEGTRSPDGRLQPLKPGIATLAVRARVPVLPVGIAGTFEAWPRHRKLPRPYPLRLHIGPPIAPEEFESLSPEEATTLIRDRMQQAIDVAWLSLEAAPGRRPTAR